MTCRFFPALGNHEDEGRLLAYDSKHTHLFNKSGTVGLKHQLYIVEGKTALFRRSFSALYLLLYDIHLHTCNLHVSWSAPIRLASFSTTIKQTCGGQDTLKERTDLIPLSALSWSCYMCIVDNSKSWWQHMSAFTLTGQAHTQTLSTTATIVVFENQLPTNPLVTNQHFWTNAEVVVSVGLEFEDDIKVINPFIRESHDSAQPLAGSYTVTLWMVGCSFRSKPPHRPMT